MRMTMELCRRLKMEFQRIAQESVSQTFSGAKDIQGFLKRLLRQIAEQERTREADPLGNIDAKPVDELKEELKKRLIDKRYQ